MPREGRGQTCMSGDTPGTSGWPEEVEEGWDRWTTKVCHVRVHY